MATQKMTPDTKWADRIAATYENSRRQRLFDKIQNTTLDLINMKSPESILDIGCGTGRFLRKVHERWPNAHLIGIDPSEGMVNEARKLAPDMTFHVAMAESVPLPDASVDLALVTLSFHHWSDPAKGIREVARVLCPNGQVVIADAALPYGLSLLIWHFNKSRPGRLRKLLTKEGLVIQTQLRLMRRFLGITIGKK